MPRETGSMRILIVSSSLEPKSRSERIARYCLDIVLTLGHEAEFISLKDYSLPPFSNVAFYHNANYQYLHKAVLSADGVILASPVYNWSESAELKRFIESVGATGDSITGAFYDKVVTFVFAAGLPHSYMSATNLAAVMMLDFKCIINPYIIYVHNRHWENDELIQETATRVQKAMTVMVELTSLLSKRTYTSSWEI
jgi:NAD(P)H-dependent FMN reductase